MTRHMYEKEKKRVLFVATVESHLLNFHIPFMKLLQGKDYEVHVDFIIFSL